MKKSALFGGIAATALLAQVVGAKIVSTNIEANMRAATQAYSELMGYPVEIKNFSPGWFSSDATLTVFIANALAAPMAELGIELPAASNGSAAEVNIDIHLTHGPLILADGVHIGAAYAHARVGADAERLMTLMAIAPGDEAELKHIRPFISDLLSAATPDLTLLADLNGDVAISTRIDGGKASIQGENQAEPGKYANMSLELAPAAFEIKLTDSATRAAMTGQLGGIDTKMQMPDGMVTVHVGKISFSGNYEPVAPQFWSGNATASFEALSFATNAKGQKVNVHIAGLTSRTATSTSVTNGDTLLDGMMEVNIPGTEIQVNGQQLTFGPVTVKGGITNALVDLMAREMQLRMAMLRGEITPDLALPAMVMGAEDFPILAERQIAANPALNLDEYSLAIGDDRVNLAGGLGFKAGLPDNVLDDPAVLAGFLQGKFVFDLDAGLARTLLYQAGQMGPQKPSAEQAGQIVDMTLAQYAAGGLLTQDGDHYSSTIVIEDNLIKVNGTPMTMLSALFAGPQPEGPPPVATTPSR